MLQDKTVAQVYNHFYFSLTMNALLQEIKSAYCLIVTSIEALPAILVAIAILFLTRYVANLTREWPLLLENVCSRANPCDRC